MQLLTLVNMQCKSHTHQGTLHKPHLHTTLGQNINFMAHEMHRKYKISFTVHEGQEMLNFLYLFPGPGQSKLDGS